ncbi:MAG: hypothetical protein COS89_01920, partial [Deltaproteobacteria bacterium CG07_land_8_20_14_0_80_38_7]
ASELGSDNLIVTTAALTQHDIRQGHEVALYQGDEFYHHEGQENPFMHDANHVVEGMLADPSPQMGKGTMVDRLENLQRQGHLQRGMQVYLVGDFNNEDIHSQNPDGSAAGLNVVLQRLRNQGVHVIPVHMGDTIELPHLEIKQGDHVQPIHDSIVRYIYAHGEGRRRQQELRSFLRSNFGIQVPIDDVSKLADLPRGIVYELRRPLTTREFRDPEIVLSDERTIEQQITPPPPGFIGMVEKAWNNYSNTFPLLYLSFAAAQLGWPMIGYLRQEASRISATYLFTSENIANGVLEAYETGPFPQRFMLDQLRYFWSGDEVNTNIEKQFILDREAVDHQLPDNNMIVAIQSFLDDFRNHKDDSEIEGTPSIFMGALTSPSFRVITDFLDARFIFQRQEQARQQESASRTPAPEDSTAPVHIQVGGDSNPAYSGASQEHHSTENGRTLAQFQPVGPLERSGCTYFGSISGEFNPATLGFDQLSELSEQIFVGGCRRVTATLGQGVELDDAQLLNSRIVSQQGNRMTYELGQVDRQAMNQRIVDIQRDANTIYGNLYETLTDTSYLDGLRPDYRDALITAIGEVNESTTIHDVQERLLQFLRDRFIYSHYSPLRRGVFQRLLQRIHDHQASPHEYVEMIFDQEQGVCCELAEVMVAGLRLAGIPVGMWSGYVIENGRVNQGSGHATAAIILPGQNGLQAIPIEAEGVRIAEGEDVPAAILNRLRLGEEVASAQNAVQQMLSGLVATFANLSEKFKAFVQRFGAHDEHVEAVEEKEDTESVIDENTEEAIGASLESESVIDVQPEIEPELATPEQSIVPVVEETVQETVSPSIDNGVMIIDDNGTSAGQFALGEEIRAANLALDAMEESLEAWYQDASENEQIRMNAAFEMLFLTLNIGQQIAFHYPVPITWEEFGFNSEGFEEDVRRWIRGRRESDSGYPWYPWLKTPCSWIFGIRDRLEGKRFSIKGVLYYKFDHVSWDEIMRLMERLPQIVSDE